MAANLEQNVHVDSSAVKNRHKIPHLAYVEFPAKVENVDKMLKTLGGEETISKTLAAGSSKKLEMKFRPDDPFCRSLHATNQNTTSLLLKVKKRYKKKPDSTSDMEIDSRVDEDDAMVEDTEEKAEYQTELVGILDTVYKFKGMCDFQYLPMQKNKNSGCMESLIEKIVPNKPEGANYLQKDVPYFILPSVFSRTDQASEFYYQPDIVPSSESLSYKVSNLLDKNIVGSGRARRPHNTYLVSSEQDEIPMNPHPEAMLVFEKGRERDSSINTLREELLECFTRRPVWSRNALRHNCTLSHRQLTVLLPSVSYYFMTGPWRACWVRFGYDPRKDPAGLQYQVLDFRIRKSLHCHKFIIPSQNPNRFKRDCTKRGFPGSKQPQDAVTAYVRPSRIFGLPQEARKTDSRDAYFIFREGLVPAYNQMFYQLCDIDHEEIQAYIGSQMAPQEGETEPPKFFKQEVLDQLRSKINDVLKKTLEDIKLEETAEDTGSTNEADDAEMNDSDDDDHDDPNENVLGDEAAENSEEEDIEIGTEFLEFLSGT